MPRQYCNAAGILTLASTRSFRARLADDALLEDKIRVRRALPGGQGGWVRGWRTMRTGRHGDVRLRHANADHWPWACRKLASSTVIVTNTAAPPHRIAGRGAVRGRRGGQWPEYQITNPPSRDDRVSLLCTLIERKALLLGERHDAPLRAIDDLRERRTWGKGWRRASRGRPSRTLTACRRTRATVHPPSCNCR